MSEMRSVVVRYSNACDATLRQATDDYGAGSRLEDNVHAMIVSDATSCITVRPHAEWMSRALDLARREPVLGALVLPKVRDAAARVAMRALFAEPEPAPKPRREG